MAKIKIISILIWSIVIFTCASFQGDITPVVNTYRGEIGVREKTGHNDGERIEMYLKTIGLPKGYAWCGAFVNWSFKQHKVKTVKESGAAAAWFRIDSNLIYKRNLFLRKSPSAGDVFGIYFPQYKLIGHVGFIDEEWTVSKSFIVTVEGNTNEAGSREGDGVYRKKRLKRQIYVVSRIPIK